MSENVILGFGAMRLPQTDEKDPASIEQKEFQEMVDYYMENGWDYFDTSYAYHNETSENAIKKALVEKYPRESFRIADKIPTWLLTKEEDNENLVNTMLKRLGIEYFDVLLIHNINRALYTLAENANSFQYIQELKEKGIARKIGFSFHDKADLLEEVLEKYGDVIDVVQIQLNYLDWESGRIQSRKCLEVCKKYNLEVIVMEPIKGGTLINIADSVKKQFEEKGSESLASWALRFAGSQDNVSIVLSGMGSMEQMKENVETFKDFKPLSSDENEFLMKMADEINKSTEISCSYCGYCIKDCPMNIPIPDYFSLYNGEKMHSLEANHALYSMTASESAPASECIECGSCVDLCTQQLNIPELLKDVSALFEVE